MNAPLFVLLLIAQGLGQTPAAPAAEAPDNKAEAAEARAVAKLLAAEYVLEDQSSGQKLQHQPEPILRWLLQLDRRFYSDVYVWTLDGRPEAVAAITSVYGARRIMETEIHSLSTGLLLMSHQGKVVWQPERGGIEWKPLPGAPRPAVTPASRLVQMRALAAQFSLKADYGKMMKEDLRLMPAPVYRYTSEKQDVVDGAMFAFARGTDPETFLLLEARKSPAGEAWQYALARFCGHCSLRALHDGREIWQVDVIPTEVIIDPKQPYCGLRKYSDFPVVK